MLRSAANECLRGRARGPPSCFLAFYIRWLEAQFGEGAGQGFPESDAPGRFR
jgi:hypothetical protein